MNSASDKQQGVARCAKVSAGGQRRAVCARACEEHACVWPAGGEAEISGEAHSTFSVEKGQKSWCRWVPSPRNEAKWGDEIAFRLV